MKKTIVLLITLFSVCSSYAQDTPANSDTLRKNALNVFMDASDYIKKEIPFVNYVRDIKDAGVYIISSSQKTGSGGYEYSFFFVGQHSNAGMKDTLTFVTTPDETDDEIRIQQVKTLKMGLMRYVARTPLAKHISINFTEPLSEVVSSDKWKSWVFRASFNSFFDGEQTYRESYLNGNISASRVTKDWKINFRGSLNYQLDKFNIDEEWIRSENNSKSLNAMIVRSIDDHWSYGSSGSLFSSSYSNQQLSWNVMPGIEYDLFPYSESTRRQLRLLYSIGYTFSNYNDSTIYDRLYEGHLMHSLNAAYEVVQKWGTIDMRVTYSNYLHDWSKNNLSINGYMSIRIVKGLSVSFGGGASLIHDQLSLQKGGATTEEILLRRKELATQFQYFTSVGLSFTFGSIYNNVVNPRFGNSGGGGMTISMD